MEEIKKIHKLFSLKEVDRYGIVKDRQESSAEHSYSSLMLAQYFLPKIKKNLDELKVMKMLLYHDVVEIEAGDTYFLDYKPEEKERNALKILKKKIPGSMAGEIEDLWEEFEENKTPEAKFCQAIDKFDPVIHFLEHKKEWKKAKVTEKIMRDRKDRYFKEFPVIMEMWDKIVDYYKKEGCFLDDK